MIKLDLGAETFRTLNALGLFLIAAVLAFAQAAQFIQHELPCPLCLLQRLAFIAVMFGLLANIIYGSRPSHYSFCIIAALLGGLFSLRQISLHVIPGTPAYGEAFFGLHFYTWAFICFVTMILCLAIIQSFSVQYRFELSYVGFYDQHWLVRLVIVFSLLMVAINVLSTVMLCGPWVCADDPQSYRMLNPL